jgi:RNA polymerase sigma-70 factor (sigma-E family)
VEWFHAGGSRSIERAFEAFVAATSDDLVRTGYLMTWDARETEDLVQETFLRVARRWDKIHRMDHPAAYARRILVNLVLDGADKRRRHRAELDLDPVGAPDPVDLTAARPFHEIENFAELRVSLEALSRQQRTVLVLRYWEDLSEAEVAEILGCSIGTVKKNTWRAMTRLRQSMLAH